MGIRQRDTRARTGGPAVFLSYRRADTEDVVADFAALLRQDLSGRRVFRDKESLIAGDDFPDAIAENIGGADAVLVIVGPEWAGVEEAPDGVPPGAAAPAASGAAADAGPRRRIDNPKDRVRQEVESALASKARVMPVLVDGAPRPTAPPDSLEKLPEKNQVSVTREDLRDRSSLGYQQSLVGIWAGMAERRPRNILIMSDQTPLAEARVDELIEAMTEGDAAEATEISRLASGASVVTLRKVKKAAKRWPEAIFVRDEEDSSALGKARVEAISRHPRLKTAALIGAGAVSGSAATLAFATSSGAAAVSGGSVTTVGAGAAISTTTAVVAVGGVAVAGGIAAATVLPGPDDATFPDTMTLEAVGDEDEYPYGRPDAVELRFGPGEPLDADAALDFFNGYEGGAAESRTLTVVHEGREYDLGTVTVPTDYPGDLIADHEGVYVISSAEAGEPVAFVDAGAGAWGPCTHEQTGDVMGGWEFTGEAGELTVNLLFESDGGAATGVGAAVLFAGPSAVSYFESALDELNQEGFDDRCTPVTTSENLWRAGAGSEV